ncbi:MAG: hypothetical protein IJ899_08065 [Blautia sp.]|nr:hypothetical protein [Blautia sp.]
MFRLVTYPDATPGKDDLANYVSSRASATIAAATQFIFGINYVTGDLDDQEVFESTYEMLFSSGSISTEENPDGTVEPFFQGIGEFFSQDDDAAGKEIVARKLHRMSQKLLDLEEFYTFDLFEEFIFYLMTEIMKALYEKAPTRREKENCYNRAAQDEAETELQERFGLSKTKAKKTARQMYRVFEMGLKEGEYENAFFWDADYSFFWVRGFVEGIRLIKGAPGDQLGYGYKHACEIFSDIGIKPPLRLLGSEEANRLVNEMARDEFRDEMEKILSSLGEKSVVERVADQNGVSGEEIRESIEEVINNLWMQPVNDTKAQEDLKKAFPDGKPSVEEFINYIASIVRKNAVDGEDLPFS